MASRRDGVWGSSLNTLLILKTSIVERNAIMVPVAHDVDSSSTADGEKEVQPAAKRNIVVRR